MIRQDIEDKLKARFSSIDEMYLRTVARWGYQLRDQEVDTLQTKIADNSIHLHHKSRLIEKQAIEIQNLKDQLAKAVASTEKDKIIGQKREWIKVIEALCVEKDQKIKQLSNDIMEKHRTSVQLRSDIRSQKLTVEVQAITINDLYKTIANNDKTIIVLNNDITNLQSVVEGQNQYIAEKEIQWLEATGKAEAQDNVIKSLRTKEKELWDIIWAWHAVANETITSGFYDHKQVPGLVLQWVRDMKTALADRVPGVKIAAYNTLRNALTTIANKGNSIHTQRFIQIANEALDEARAIGQGKEPQVNTTPVWFDAATVSPPKKGGSGFSDFCLLQFDSGVYDIGAYDWAVNKWKGYPGFPHRQPKLWQPINPPVISAT